MSKIAKETLLSNFNNPLWIANSENSIKFRMLDEQGSKVVDVVLDSTAPNVMVTGSAGYLSNFIYSTITQFTYMYKPSDLHISVVANSETLYDTHIPHYDLESIERLPHVRTMTFCENENDVIAAIRSIINRLKRLKEFVAEYNIVSDFNKKCKEHNRKPVSRNVIYLHELGYLINDESLNVQLQNLMGELCILARDTNTHIIWTEESIDIYALCHKVIDHFDNRLVFHSKPEDSKFVIGTDMGCLVNGEECIYRNYATPMLVYRRFPLISTEDVRNNVTYILECSTD